MTKAQIQNFLKVTASDKSENAILSTKFVGGKQVRKIVYGMLEGMMERQTNDEQASEVTCYQNGVGFNGADAKLLCNIANKSKEYKNLTPKQSRYVAGRLIKYAGQIEEIIAEKKTAIAA